MWGFEGDYVKSARGLSLRFVFLKIQLGSLYNASALGGRYGFRGTGVAVVIAGTHFNKHERWAVPGDDINLSRCCAKVALRKAQSLALQPCRRAGFVVVPDDFQCGVLRVEETPL